MAVEYISGNIGAFAVNTTPALSYNTPASLFTQVLSGKSYCVVAAIAAGGPISNPQCWDNANTAGTQFTFAGHATVIGSGTVYIYMFYLLSPVGGFNGGTQCTFYDGSSHITENTAAGVVVYRGVHRVDVTDKINSGSAHFPTTTLSIAASILDTKLITAFYIPNPGDSKGSTWTATSGIVQEQIASVAPFTAGSLALFESVAATGGGATITDSGTTTSATTTNPQFWGGVGLELKPFLTPKAAVVNPPSFISSSGASNQALVTGAGTVAVSVPTTVAAGSWYVIAIGANGTTISSITDSQGNSYSSISSNVDANLWYSHTAHQLTSSDTITAHVNGGAGNFVNVVIGAYKATAGNVLGTPTGSGLSTPCSVSQALNTTGSFFIACLTNTAGGSATVTSGTSRANTTGTRQTFLVDTTGAGGATATDSLSTNGRATAVQLGPTTKSKVAFWMHS